MLVEYSGLSLQESDVYIVVYIMPVAIIGENNVPHDIKGRIYPSVSCLVLDSMTLTTLHVKVLSKERIWTYSTHCGPTDREGEFAKNFNRICLRMRLLHQL